MKTFTHRFIWKKWGFFSSCKIYIHPDLWEEYAEKAYGEINANCIDSFDFTDLSALKKLWAVKGQCCSKQFYFECARYHKLTFGGSTSDHHPPPWNLLCSRKNRVKIVGRASHKYIKHHNIKACFNNTRATPGNICRPAMCTNKLCWILSSYL